MVDEPKDPRASRRGEGAGPADPPLDRTAPLEPVREDAAPPADPTATSPHADGTSGSSPWPTDAGTNSTSSERRAAIPDDSDTPTSSSQPQPTEPSRANDTKASSEPQPATSRDDIDTPTASMTSQHAEPTRDSADGPSEAQPTTPHDHGDTPTAAPHPPTAKPTHNRTDDPPQPQPTTPQDDSDAPTAALKPLSAQPDHYDGTGGSAGARRATAADNGGLGTASAASRGGERDDLGAARDREDRTALSGRSDDVASATGLEPQGAVARSDDGSTDGDRDGPGDAPSSPRDTPASSGTGGPHDAATTRSLAAVDAGDQEKGRPSQDDRGANGAGLAGAGTSPGDEPAPTRRYTAWGTGPTAPTRGFEGVDGSATTRQWAVGRGSDDPGSTRRFGPGDDEPTVADGSPYGGDDRTTRIQNTGPRNATPPANDAWAGRAGVPQPGGPGGPPNDDGGWVPGPSDGGRRWWMPILLGIIALILLAVLAFGLWLILRGDGGGAPTPSPSPTPTARPTTATPTTAAPTTTAPSPTATAPTAVPVPEVAGLTVIEAGQRLSDAGLSARLRYVDSAEPAGTVVGADPKVGTTVPVGSTVTLTVSSGRTMPPTTPPPTTPPTSPPATPPGP